VSRRCAEQGLPKVRGVVASSQVAARDTAVAEPGKSSTKKSPQRLIGRPEEGSKPACFRPPAPL